jgi:hypothetical protein
MHLPLAFPSVADAMEAGDADAMEAQGPGPAVGINDAGWAGPELRFWWPRANTEMRPPYRNQGNKFILAFPFFLFSLPDAYFLVDMI